MSGAEGATAPETLRPQGPIDRQKHTLERGAKMGVRRRDNDLRQKDRGGITRMGRSLVRSEDAGVFRGAAMETAGKQKGRCPWVS